MIPALILAVATFLAALVSAVHLAIGLRSLPRLRRIGPPPDEGAPRVSVVVAARNEARNVAAAVGTLRAQDYPNYEVVVVNDRSTDGTGAILDRLRETTPGGSSAELRVLHVGTLPEGWLGKNHALQRGAEEATGTVLLFTDADVMMHPDTLARAVAMLERGGLDHLAVAPRIHVGGAWATATVAVFLVAFSAFFRPWRARDPQSRHHIGIGAFNLVRTDAYRSIGGHRDIALRPDDDVKLGQRLKRAGHRQAAAIGRDHLSVEWYASLRAMARGLRKNTFAVVDYRLSLVALATLLPVVFTFGPILALGLTDGVTMWLNAGVVALGVFTVADTARIHGLPLWVGLAYPIGSALLLWMVWSAALRAVLGGGIEWRGTRYRLDELRKR